MNMKPNTGRKRAQRQYPIAPDDPCDACGGIKTLHRHHKDHDPSNNNPENIALLCSTCHGLEHRRVQQANCQICGEAFQPKRTRRSVLCGKPKCLSEMGRRSVALRLARRQQPTDLKPLETDKSPSVQPLLGEC